MAGKIKMMNAHNNSRASSSRRHAHGGGDGDSVGCTNISDWKPSTKMFSLDNTWPFKDKDKPHEGKPDEMVCTWTTP